MCLLHLKRYILTNLTWTAVACFHLVSQRKTESRTLGPPVKISRATGVNSVAATRWGPLPPRRQLGKNALISKTMKEVRLQNWRIPSRTIMRMALPRPSAHLTAPRGWVSCLIQPWLQMSAFTEDRCGCCVHVSTGSPISSHYK